MAIIVSELALSLELLLVGGSPPATTVASKARVVFHYWPNIIFFIQSTKMNFIASAPDIVFQQKRWPSIVEQMVRPKRVWLQANDSYQANYYYYDQHLPKVKWVCRGPNDTCFRAQTTDLIKLLLLLFWQPLRETVSSQVKFKGHTSNEFIHRNRTKRWTCSSVRKAPNVCVGLPKNFSLINTLLLAYPHSVYSHCNLVELNSAAPN